MQAIDVLYKVDTSAAESQEMLMFSCYVINGVFTFRFGLIEMSTSIKRTETAEKMDVGPLLD